MAPGAFLTLDAAGFFVCKLKKLSNEVKKAREGEEGSDDEEGGAGSDREEGAEGAGGARRDKKAKAPAAPQQIIIPVSKPKVRAGACLSLREAASRSWRCWTIWRGAANDVATGRARNPGQGPCPFTVHLR